MAEEGSRTTELLTQGGNLSLQLVFTCFEMSTGSIEFLQNGVIYNGIPIGDWIVSIKRVK